MRICLGGTFETIHKGHEAMLSQAFKICALEKKGYVYIGITSDEFAKLSKKYRVSKFEKRKKNLLNYLKKKGFGNFELGKLEDRFGPAVDGDFDVCVVSPESKRYIPELNAKRNAAGKSALKAFVVDYVLADDLKPISSTRIKEGKITTTGRLRQPIKIAVGSKNVVKVEAVRNVFTRISKKVEVFGFDTRSKVSEQPIGSETIQGAINRARASWECASKEGIECDYSVGIEAGLVWNEILKDYLDVQYCAVLDEKGKITVGHGSGFIYPRSMIEEVHAGKTMGEVFESFTGIDAIGSKMGAIGYLTDLRLTRTELTEQGVFMALVPRMKPALYENDYKHDYSENAIKNGGEDA